MLDYSALISTFHGGFFAWDIKQNQLVVTDIRADSLLPVVLMAGKLSVVIDTIPYFIYFDKTKMEFGLTIYSKDINYIIEYQENCFAIKLDNHYLTCEKNRTLNFAATKLNSWERYSIISGQCNQSDMNFNKDVFMMHNGGDEIHLIPSNIWIYWEQGEKPKLVENCINRIILFNPNYNVHVLDRINLHEYIKDKNLLCNLDGFSVQFKSDIIRLYLLKEYGGVWLDASVILNDSLDSMLPKNNTYDVIGFYFTKYYKSNSLNKVPIIENWFLASGKNSPFISEWLDWLLLAIEVGQQGIQDKLKNRDDFHIIRNVFNDGQLLYFTAYLTQQAIFLDNAKKYNVLARCVDYSGFYYACVSGWNNQFKYKELMFEPEYNIQFLPKVMKIVGTERKALEELNKKGILDGKSYLYQLLN